MLWPAFLLWVYILTNMNSYTTHWRLFLCVVQPNPTSSNCYHCLYGQFWDLTTVKLLLQRYRKVCLNAFSINFSANVYSANSKSRKRVSKHVGHVGNGSLACLRVWHSVWHCAIWGCLVDWHQWHAFRSNSAAWCREPVRLCRHHCHQ